MLLLMIEQDMPIDVVLTADTGMEFPEMYEHLQKLDDLLCRERGIHITTLRHPRALNGSCLMSRKRSHPALRTGSGLGYPSMATAGLVLACAGVRVR